MNIAELYDRSYAFARVVGAKGDRPIKIAIAIDPRVMGDPTAQLIAITLCNLLPRITERYTNVDLRVSGEQETTIPRAHAGRLLPLLQATFKGACLGGIFEDAQNSEGTYDYCFVVGEKSDVVAHCAIYVWASGWRCFVSKSRSLHRPSPRSSVNPFSAVAAASLASMILYHDAEGLRERFHSDEINGWSLFDYGLALDDGPVLPASIDVGRIIQAGLGGTAQALLWTLRHGPELRGEWHGFEHELLDISNANRYLLMNVTDTGPKALLATSRFASVHPALNFQVTEGRVEKESFGLLDSTVVLATVDDPQIRVALQNRGAGLILNVGTNSQCLSISRHELRLIREGGPCVECFYGSNEQAPRRMRESTVSFVVALVGAVLGAELVKACSFRESVLSNSWVANVFAPCQNIDPRERKIKVIDPFRRSRRWLILNPRLVVVSELFLMSCHGENGEGPSHPATGTHTRTEVTGDRNLKKRCGGVSCGALHSQARETVTQGYTATLVAATLPISRSSLYYRKQPRVSRADRTYDEQIVVACGEKPAYGYRWVAWWLRRKEGLTVNRKRVLRVMRERGLLVRSRRLRARKKKEWGRVEAAEPN